MNHEVLISVLTALLLISESLGGLKGVAENAIYQVIVRIMKVLYQTITGKVSPSNQALIK